MMNLEEMKKNSVSVKDVRLASRVILAGIRGERRHGIRGEFTKSVRETKRETDAEIVGTARDSRPARR